MRPGTPGFIGNRLIEAREAREVSTSALADLLQISRQVVYAYEKGTRTPSPDVMTKIADLLGQPVSFFLESDVPSPVTPVFFRSRKAALKTQRLKAKRYQQWAAELATRLSTDVDLPDPSLPPAYAGDFRGLSMDVIEELAMAARTHWRMGAAPVPNMVRLLESSGVITVRLDLEADDLDGLSAWFSDRPIVVLVSNKGSAVRSKAAFDLVEVQAHRFAAAFLLPSESFADECVSFSLDTFRVLKERWKVSIGMMIQRAWQLGFISDQQRTRLFVNRAQRGWTRREPLDDQLPLERPEVLAMALGLLVEDRGLDAVLAAQRIGVSDISRLAGVSPQELAGRTAPVVRLPIPVGRPAVAGGEAAPVIPLTDRRQS